MSGEGGTGAGTDDSSVQQPTGGERQESTSTAEPTGGRSVVDIAQHDVTKQYVKYVTGVYAVVGVAIGVVAILVASVADPVVFSEQILTEMADAEAEQAAQMQDFLEAQYATVFSSFLLSALIPLTVAMGAGVGGYVGSRFDVVRPAAVVSGLSSAVGTFVALIVGGILLSTQMEAPPDQEGSGASLFRGGEFMVLDGSPTFGYDLIFEHLLVTSVLVAVGAALAAVATVYVLNSVGTPPRSFPEA